MFKNKKAFTLTEMIMVIVMIGILMMGTTIYLQGSDDTRKIIEAQGCASTIGGIINNYIFYSLTSKNLRISDSETESPDLYTIKLTDCNSSDHLCDSFKFFDYKYEDGNYIVGNYEETYKIAKICHASQSKIKVKRESGNDSSEIKMNKGFTRTKKSNLNIFYIQDGGTTKLVGDIILVVCFDDNCTKAKEVSKRAVDGRTQTISLRNCGFYKEDDKYKCEEREN